MSPKTNAEEALQLKVTNVQGHSKPVGAFLVAALAFIVTLILEAFAMVIIAEATGSRLRGSPIFVLPALAVSIWVWRWVRSNSHRGAVGRFKHRFQSLNREGRYTLVLSGIWVAVLVAFWLTAEPYRFADTAERLLLFLLWLTLPPVALRFFIRALRWAAEGRPS